MRKQFAKLGNTPFVLRNFQCNITGEVFAPVGELNALRRAAVEALQRKLSAPWERTLQDGGTDREESNIKEIRIEETASRKTVSQRESSGKKSLTVSIVSFKQLQALAAQPQKWNGVSRIYVPDTLWEKGREEITCLQQQGKACYLRFPRISRGNWKGKLEKMLERADGVLVSNLEELQFLRELGTEKPVIADSSLYVWNREAKDFLSAYVEELTLPLELNQHEKKELGEGCFEEILYGRTPLMHTANCVRKTCGTCRYEKKEQDRGEDVEFWNLTDRYHKNFPVQFDCVHCTNVIYNSVPQSLHGAFSQIMAQPSILSGRLEFTDESASQMERILMGYQQLLAGKKAEFPLKEYTTGHYKRGVE